MINLFQFFCFISIILFSEPNDVCFVTGENPVRYAVTADVTITEATYIQFYLSMGCQYKDRCFGKLTPVVVHCDWLIPTLSERVSSCRKQSEDI